MTSVQTASKSSKERTAVLVLIVLVVFALIASTAMAATASWTHLQLAFHAVEKSRASVTPSISATAVEVGLLSLALAGALLAVLAGTRDSLIQFATGLFAVVSFLANVYAGLDARTNGKITVDALDNLSKLDWTVVVVGAGTLPVMVVVLTHVTITVCRQAREWWTGEIVQTTKTDDPTSVQDAPPVLQASPPIGHVPPAPSYDEIVAAQEASRGRVWPRPESKPAPDPIAAYIAEHGEKHVDDVAKGTGISRAKIYSMAKRSEWIVEKGMVKAA